MNTMMIRLDNFEKLKSFVDDCSQFDEEMEVVSGRSIANAKSILGLMTLDLMHPLELRIISSESKSDEIMKLLRIYQL